MGTLHDHDPVETDILNPDLLKARLSREKLARNAAETLLEEKSKELHLANKALQKVAEAVESQRVQLDTILDHTLTGVALVNSQLGITRANRKIIALFELGVDYFAEMTIADLFEDYASISHIYEQCLGEGPKPDDVLYESVGRRVDGSTFPLEFGLTCMELDGRQHSVWIFRDISKRKHEEAKRKALENELSQAQKMEALGTLASGVAHEINTPIQYINDNLHFLKDTISDLFQLIELLPIGESDLEMENKGADLVASVKAKAEEIDLDFLREEAPLSVDQSLEGIKQVASIVQAIKEFSHPGEDERTELDLNHLVETTLTVARNQWKYVADVETDFSSDLPMIEGLPGDINQVILNLVVNAADAIETAEREPKGLISISTTYNEDKVVLSIGDNGCGIPNDIAQRIFDPFFTTKGVGKGSGQGLAITYSIVKQKHNGTITCSSKPDVGTTFTLTFPRKKLEAEATAS